MDQEKERQLTMLQEIYDNWTPPTPAFKAHHEGVPEGGELIEAANEAIAVSTVDTVAKKSEVDTISKE